jgi:hypothetical protein
MNSRYAFLLLVATVAITLADSPARAGDALVRARPCGPDSIRGPLRLLIPQGAYGADFRPACRAHDACYDTPGANRAACDAKFLEDMLCACEQSRHPALCRRKARAMYRITAKRGEKSFREAQLVAQQKLNAE